jgi:hypothetical protein
MKRSRGGPLFPMALSLGLEVKNMKHQIRSTLWLVIFAAIATLSLPAGAVAQTVVVGTGNPDIDVPAVQAAVDQGGDVVLKGHFSFDRSPTIPTAPAGYPPAMILVSKAVAISGARDEHDHDGEVTTIDAGTIPFYVEAPGAHVSIEGLRFIQPQQVAVLVYAVSGLVIASCKIEGAVPVDHVSAGFAIATVFNPPTPMNPGKPENVSGTLLIVNNVINVAGGTALDQTLGVVIFSVGVPGAEVEVYISRNTITNTTERSINLYQIDGRAHIERNVITTSNILGNANVAFGRGTDVIHVTGTGSYLVAGNSVHSRWAAATGIRVQGQSAGWPIIGAVVVDNDVTMDAPQGTVFDENSAGIDVRGNAQDNVVLNNRIRGRARAALVVAVNQSSMIATNNHFILNRVAHFEASFADVFVGQGVMNTLIVGQGTVVDQGVGTDVVPVVGRGEDKDNH